MTGAVRRPALVTSPHRLGYSDIAKAPIRIKDDEVSFIDGLQHSLPRRPRLGMTAPDTSPISRVSSSHPSVVLFCG